MQQPPQSIIDAWPTPNYVDPPTRGSAKVVLNIVMFTLLLLCISLRLWTRRFLKNIFGADDLFILIAVIPTTGFFIISVLADTKFMWTRHTYDIPRDHVETGLKMVLTVECMFAAACTLTKLSMLMLVRRMLSGASLVWRRVTSIATTAISLQGIVFCLIVVFQCRPPQDYWKVTTGPQPNCVDQSSTLLVAGIINTLTDFACVLLPIRVVWSLQLRPREAGMVITLFGLGFVSCFAGIVRTYYMYRVTNTWDQVWESYPVWISAAVELYIGIICASVPATKPFFSTYLPAVFGGASTIPSEISSEYRRRSQQRASSVPIVDIVEMEMRTRKSHLTKADGEGSVTSREEGGDFEGIRVMRQFSVTKM